MEEIGSGPWLKEWLRSKHGVTGMGPVDAPWRDLSVSALDKRETDLEVGVEGCIEAADGDGRVQVVLELCNWCIIVLQGGLKGMEGMVYIEMPSGPCMDHCKNSNWVRIRVSEMYESAKQLIDAVVSVRVNSVLHLVHDNCCACSNVVIPVVGIGETVVHLVL